MHQIDISADRLITALLRLSETETVCILDSCGVGKLGSNLLIVGIEPVETLEISADDPEETLTFLDEKLSGDFASIFTISYGFGMKLLGINARPKENASPTEPDIYIARFAALIIHDYDAGKTSLAGNADKFEAFRRKLSEHAGQEKIPNAAASRVSSNFTKAEYIVAIETIKERIRRGDTYQTNLTQQLTATLPDNMAPQQIFYRLRRDHPAPFAAFIKRLDSTVVSASPERFIKTGGNPTGRKGASIRQIVTSPIKGTRPRGRTAEEDMAMREDLLASSKDRAENMMIVDLLRNDLGRVCDYGSVHVERLCELEEHPTFFDLVSTVTGGLRQNIRPSEIFRALFPCGSITGAPKISTMRIIDEIETTDRGLSMGAIGYYIPQTGFGMPEKLELSVAIRTMVIRENIATFNVGGGIVIDSDPEMEYEETVVKAQALLNAIGGQFP